MKLKAGSIPMATFSHLLFKSIGEILRGSWANSVIKSKEGIAVNVLLVWYGRHATTLVAAGNILNKLNEIDSINSTKKPTGFPVSALLSL